MVLTKPDSDPLQEIYRRNARRVYATLVRLLGSFELAEDALHNAFVAAAERWPREGVPKNPFAWLVSTGRYKAIDQLRRRRRMTPRSDAAEQIDAIASRPPSGAAPFAGLATSVGLRPPAVTNPATLSHPD